MQAAPAAADVLEIGAGGQVTVYNQPAVFTRDGVTPIAPQISNLAVPSVAPVTPAAASTPPPAVTTALNHAGKRTAVSPRLLEAVAWAESRFNQNARSPRGAVGVMQLMPRTARELGVNAADRDANINGGAAYLRRMLEMFDGNIERALAAYNAGPDAVRRYRGVPPFAETKAYVAAVLNYMADRAEQEGR